MILISILGLTNTNHEIIGLKKRPATVTTNGVINFDVKIEVALSIQIHRTGVKTYTLRLHTYLE